MSYWGCGENNGDARIPPPPGRVKDRGGMQARGSSEQAIERDGDIFCESARLVRGSYVDDNLGSVGRLPKLTEHTGVVEEVYIAISVSVCYQDSQVC